MLGSFGETQLSASSLANQYYFIFYIFCMGLGGGTAVMTAQYWGENDTESIKKTTTLMLRICFLVATGFMILTILFPREIMSIYTKDNTVISSGVEYFRYLSLVFIFHGLALTMTIVLRSVGTVKMPLFASIFSFGLNVFLNWVFIFGKLGMPRMEIGGAAIGTLLARISEFAIIFTYLFFFDKKINYKFKDLIKEQAVNFSEFFTVAMPVIVSDLILVFGNNALAMIMARMGKEMVAANAITTVIVQLSTVFIRGISGASGVIIGNTVGRKEIDKAQQQGQEVLIMSIIIGIIASVVIKIINPFLIKFYNIMPETKDITESLLDTISYMIIFQSISSVMTKGVLRGGGDTKFLMVADVFFLWAASVPLGYCAGLVWKWQPAAVYFCLKIDLIIKSIWCIYRLKSKNWIRIVKRLDVDDTNLNYNV